MRTGKRKKTHWKHEQILLRDLRNYHKKIIVLERLAKSLIEMNSILIEATNK